MAAGRRRPRAAGRLARPPAPLEHPGRRPDRRRRAGPADLAARDADRGAPAVLRRLHPRPRAARGHRRRLARRRRRPAVPVPRRARGDRRGGRGPAGAHPVAGRGGRRAAPQRRRPGRRAPRCGPPPPVGWPGWRPSPPTVARWCRWPTPRPGGAPGRSAGRSDRCATPTSRCRCRPASSSTSRCARPSGSSPARPAAWPASTSRPTSARWCTRWPSGSPPASSTPAPTVSTSSWATSSRSGTAWSSARRGPRRASSSGSGPPWPGSSRWHHANTRTVVGIEQPFRAVLELPDGEQVSLGGYADRLELDADGRVVVVDLKTGRTKPSDKSVLTNVQLGLYQLAVDHGAADELRRPRGARPGGAELVQLGLTGDDERRHRPAASPTRPTTAPSGRPCAVGWPGPPSCCAARTSPRSPASTAATATSSRSARSRARARWSAS